MAKLDITIGIATQPFDVQIRVALFEVYTHDGEILAEGVTSVGHPAQLTVERQAMVVVVGRLASGLTCQEAIELDKANDAVDLFDRTSPSQMFSDATCRRLPERTPSPQRKSKLLGDVWATLWRLRDGHWYSTAVEPNDRSDVNHALIERKRINVEWGDGPYLLQIGGPDTPWRITSLPSMGDINVSIVRDAARAGRTVKVSNSQSGIWDDVMRLLAQGANRDAVEVLVAFRKENPVTDADVDVALEVLMYDYLFIRAGKAAQRPKAGETFSSDNHLADTSIIRAALALQRAKPNVEYCRALVMEAIRKGPPLFSLGLDILEETMGTLHRGEEESEEFKRAFVATKSYQAARFSDETYLTISAVSPVMPSVHTVLGSPSRPYFEERESRSVSSAHRLPKLSTPRGLRPLTAQVTIRTHDSQPGRLFYEKWMKLEPEKISLFSGALDASTRSVLRETARTVLPREGGPFGTDIGNSSAMVSKGLSSVSEDAAPPRKSKSPAVFYLEVKSGWPLADGLFDELLMSFADRTPGVLLARAFRKSTIFPDGVLVEIKKRDSIARLATFLQRWVRRHNATIELTLGDGSVTEMTSDSARSFHDVLRGGRPDNLDASLDL